MVYSCTVCNQEVATIAGLCTHIRFVHPQSVVSVYKCCVCPKTYTTLQYLKKHLTEKHPDGNVDLPNPNNQNGAEQIDDDLGMDVEQDEPPIQDNNEEENDINVFHFKTAVYKSCLSLAAKLYAQNSLNRSQIQDLMCIVSDFAGHGFLDLLRQKTFSMLRFYNGPAENVEQLGQMFDSIQDLLFGLSTERQRIKAFEESDCFVHPESYDIGDVDQFRRVDGALVEDQVTSSGQYISMKKILKQFLQLPGVLRSTLANIEMLKNSRSFTNVIQSPLWRDIEDTHFRNRLVLPLTLYFDDAEPDNNTGAHAGAHKLGLVYYQVACIPQHLLSSLENIFVASVFLSEDRPNNYERTFRPIINDLRDLETDGILVQTEEGDHQVYFALALLVGDNLAIHSLIGYVESFSANYFCRVCKEHKLVTRQQTRENVDLLRTIENYRYDITIDDYSLTGIKLECIWNQLLSFHNLKNVAFDIMHDFLEGVCHYDLCALILALIEMNFFTLETLNDRIQGFDYGFDSANKPSIISIEHIRNEKIRMSASEMFFFVRHFGLIIGDLVPEDNEEWQLYVYLADILGIVSSPSVRNGSAECLATQIAEHHEVYTTVFNKTLKPKHHFMVHYPRIREFVGPLINAWCMRLEGKHRPVVKQSARSHTSRRNLPLTTAMRYCLGLCARMIAKRGFPEDVVFHSMEKNIRDLQSFEEFWNFLPEGYENSTVVREATICGTFYKRNMVLTINYENDLPLFALIEGVVKPLRENVKACFLLSGLYTVGFSEHLHCYEVRPNAEWFLVDYEQLIS